MKANQNAISAQPAQLSASPSMPGKEPPTLQLQASKGNQPVQLSRTAGPPIPAGPQFETFMANLFPLEQAAIRQGMTLNQRISAFRKLYYRGFQAGPMEMWDAIIPLATNNDMPEAWSQGALAQNANNLASNQVITISAREVDMGHLFAGLDAMAHNSPITIGVATMTDNAEAATWVGDLSAVAGEFYRDFKAGGGKDDYSNVELVNGTFVDQQTDALTRRYFTEQFSVADFHGDLDPYAININPNLTIHSNLYNYYHVSQDGQGQTRRYTRFAQNCGLFDSRLQLIDSRVERVKRQLIEATIMYQAAEYRDDIGFNGDSADWGAANQTDIFGNPKYFKEHHIVNNIVDILIDYFIRRIQLGIRQEHD